MKKLVIVGCGRLGGIVAEAVIKGILPEYDLVGVYSRTVSKAESMAARMQEQGKPCLACTTIADLLALKPAYLVEAASPAAMRELAIPTLKNGTSIVTLSIGALADDDFYREVSETAKAHGTRVYLASGATGGFDVLRTASLMGNASAKFFNEKGPNALPNQGQCHRCRLTGFGRPREHAGHNAVHPRIYGRYTTGRDQERPGTCRNRRLQRDSRDSRLVSSEYAAEHHLTHRLLRGS